MKRAVIIAVIITLLSMIIVGTAGAQEVTEQELTCVPVEEGGTVAGTVIGVGEEGTVDILLEDGTCVTVAFEAGDYDHPIVALLGAYFGGAAAEDYADALATLELEEGVVTELEEQEDGTWLATLDNGETLVIELPELAAELQAALDALKVSLNVSLNGDGEAVVGSVGEEIEAYHEDGIGFGVLVKIYAIAAESAEACSAAEVVDPDAEVGEVVEPEAEVSEVDDCAVTVEQLIADFETMGMGRLFQLYGKPTLLGVGHVRQAMGASAGTDSTSGTSGDGGTSKGICNARERGGNANAKGQDVTCP